MYSYIDLFAGCGGLSDGFEKTQKYRGIAHVEWEKVAVETLTKRLKFKWGLNDARDKVLYFDIQRVIELINGWDDPNFGQSKGLKGLLGSQKKIDLLIGGPPCQAYSLAGRIRDENGMQDDYRNFLFESYVDITNWAKPDIFLFENVPGILSAAPGGIPIVTRIKKAFDKAGYVTLDNFKNALFDLSDFGIPQKRSRVIIIGLKKTSYANTQAAKKILEDFYKSFRDKYKISKPINSKKALQGLTKYYPSNEQELFETRLSYGPTKTKFLNHVPRFHSERDIKIFKLLAEDLKSGELKYQSVDALKKLYTLKTGKTSAVHKYHVIRPNEPSNTIPAHLYKDGLRHIHWDPEQARSLTVREAARLQTFDDDFEFLGSMGDQYKMIGNAVPPKFANLLALHIYKLLKQRGN